MKRMNEEGGGVMTEGARAEQARKFGIKLQWVKDGDKISLKEYFKFSLD